MFSQRLYLVAILLLHPGIDNGISKALEGLIWNNAIFLQKNNLISQHVSRLKKKKVIVPHRAQSCWVIAEMMRHCCKQQQVSQPEIWNKTKQSKGVVVHVSTLLVFRSRLWSTQLRGTSKHISFQRMRLL